MNKNAKYWSVIIEKLTFWWPFIQVIKYHFYKCVHFFMCIFHDNGLDWSWDRHDFIILNFKTYKTLLSRTKCKSFFEPWNYYLLFKIRYKFLTFAPTFSDQRDFKSKVLTKIPWIYNMIKLFFQHTSFLHGRLIQLSHYYQLHWTLFFL